MFQTEFVGRFKIVASDPKQAVETALQLVNRKDFWELRCEYDYSLGKNKVYSLSMKYGDKVA